MENREYYPAANLNPGAFYELMLQGMKEIGFVEVRHDPGMYKNEGLETVIHYPIGEMRFEIYGPEDNIITTRSRLSNSIAKLLGVKSFEFNEVKVMENGRD